MKSTEQLQENLDELKAVFTSTDRSQVERNYAESAIEEAEALRSIGRTTCASNESTKALIMLNN